LLIKAIRNAVDPSSPDFMVFVAKNPRRDRQPVVDTAFFAQGLLRSRNGIWEKLDGTTRQMVIDALVSSRGTEPYGNNWLLFAGEIEAFLLEATGECDIKRLRKGIDKFAHDWYVGDGYYSDGPYFAFDGYNSFVIHPMFYDIANTMAKHGIKDGSEYLALAMKRLRRYADVQERSISPEGTYPLLGKSLAYRCGIFHLLSQAVLLKVLPRNISPAQVRCALTKVIKRQFNGNQNFNSEGWLICGVNGSQIGSCEDYINTGSLYSCCAIFLPLGLNSNDVFWNAPFEEWTCLKAWNNNQIQRDQPINF
jgi:hypothetical protein